MGMIRLAVLAISLLLGACTVLPPAGEEDFDALPPGAVSDQPAVIQLAARAESYLDVGDYERGASELERALRIEPGNAELWHRLARLRYRQGQFAQAVHLASKSNVLAPAASGLRRRNLILMANAYEAQGDFNRAERIRSGIRP